MMLQMLNSTVVEPGKIRFNNNVTAVYLLMLKCLQIIIYCGGCI